MSTDDIPAPGTPDSVRSRAELDQMIEMLWTTVQGHQARIRALQKKISDLEPADDTTGGLAAWAPFPPPPAAEDRDVPSQDTSPLVTIAHFVDYYNGVYVGISGSKAQAIPDCWLDHPALVAELATLAYTWRDTHLGKNATARDAQYWHDRWRVGFADRLTDWVHPHCRTTGHKPAGSPSKTDRFTLAHRATDPDPSVRQSRG